METILITVLVVLTVAVVWLVYLFHSSQSQSRREISGQTASINLLQQQLEAMRNSQDTAARTLQTNLQTSLQSSMETITRLNTQIGELKGSSQKLMELGGDVRSLRDILQSPKLRGQLGEQSLGNLLKNILPADSFVLQQPFRNGKIVDALVNMPNFSVPIDAKFPLPSFEAMLRAQNDDERSKLRRQFQSDVTKHIDKIASSYILPQEGTVDFAMMYIPAENVYYETIIKQEGDKIDIADYALTRKVFPVSPNLLYAYLMTVAMGLQGMQIEKQAGEIRKNLGLLAGAFEAFVSDYGTLGGHLRNAYNKYDEGQKRLDKFTLQLEQIKKTEQEDETK